MGRAPGEIPGVDDTNHSAVCRAFAKVNLTLSVLGRRPDGYHEVSTLMAPVGLHDVLTFTRRERGITISCPALPDVPPEKNLAFKAADALLRTAGAPLGVDISIDKRIPAGSGMGGGSSDAAATLLEVNRMLSAEVRLDSTALHHLAAMIGADVPFFLGPDARPATWRAALCTGIGDVVEPIDGARLGAIWLVVVSPGFAVNTAQAYADWDASVAAPAREAARPREALAISALLSGDPARLAASLSNDLEAAVSGRYPDIEILKRMLVDCGALDASMTGSGSAVYGVCGSFDHAVSVRDKFESTGGAGKAARVIVTGLGCDE